MVPAMRLSTHVRVFCLAMLCSFNTENKGEEDDNECCICMERKAEVILACAHNFCEICIDSWTRYAQSAYLLM